MLADGGLYFLNRRRSWSHTGNSPPRLLAGNYARTFQGMRAGELQRRRLAPAHLASVGDLQGVDRRAQAMHGVDVDLAEQAR